MKNILKVLTAASFIAVMFFNVNLLTTQKNEEVSFVSITNANASSISEWWDSTVYDCIVEDCSSTYGFPPFTGTYWGEYENCEDGSAVAHCWDCSDCNAGWF